MSGTKPIIRIIINPPSTIRQGVKIHRGGVPPYTRKDIERHGFRFAPLASQESIGRIYKTAPDEFRPDFLRDCDKIEYTGAYRRLEHKTQVFVEPQSDYLQRRSYHVEQVASVGTSIALSVGLNTWLVRAIALGHDIGHSPFGHEGERVLNELYRDAQKLLGKNEGEIIPFKHNVQSLIAIDQLEHDLRYARINLTHEVRDGIVCHNGETTESEIIPRPYLFPWLESPEREEFPTGIPQRKILKRNLQKAQKSRPDWLREQFGKFIMLGADASYMPFTLEGCLVRLADRIAFLPTDFEEAVRHGIFKRGFLAEKEPDVYSGLGNNAADILHTVITDVIRNSNTWQAPGKIAMSKGIAELLARLFHFNRKHIYLNARVKGYTPKVRMNMEILFRFFTNYSYEDIGYQPKYRPPGRILTPEEAINEIASMTDREALQTIDRILAKVKIVPSL